MHFGAHFGALRYFGTKHLGAKHFGAKHSGAKHSGAHCGALSNKAGVHSIEITPATHRGALSQHKHCGALSDKTGVHSFEITPADTTDHGWYQYYPNHQTPGSAKGFTLTNCAWMALSLLLNLSLLNPNGTHVKPQERGSGTTPMTTSPNNSYAPTNLKVPATLSRQPVRILAVAVPEDKTNTSVGSRFISERHWPPTYPENT